MFDQKPGLFGIENSNRDFTQKETWGKNQFNSSFPAALSSYLSAKELENIYLYLESDLKVKHGKVSTKKLFGVAPSSKDLFYAFESPYMPYQNLLIGHLPRVDLVTQLKSNGQILRPIEIKLTALPDNSTCNSTDDKFGTELVIRPDTIVYLACSIVINFKGKQDELKALIGKEFDNINDWSNGSSVWKFIPKMILAIDKVILSILDKQEPLVMQPIWKTEGKSPNLSNNCLDVFVWSNFAFVQLFLDVARGELKDGENKITRQVRTIIWLFKMLLDYSKNGQINHQKIIDELSYNTKNDKAFAVSGRVTHPYMQCAELKNPRITKDEIKKIIIGDGQNLLSPERRFDAIIYNSPELFK
jgi:HindVP restriction endonuclease